MVFSLLMDVICFAESKMVLGRYDKCSTILRLSSCYLRWFRFCHHVMGLVKVVG